MICSGESDRQVKAIADHVDAMLSSHQEPPLSIEGSKTCHWILLDFGDVITHVFRSDIRDHYRLEKLWGDAKKIPLPAEPLESLLASDPAKHTRPTPLRAKDQG